MANSLVSAAVCSVCGEQLGRKGECFACLLRAGLDEADQPVASEVAALFDDFEVARREDGSLWELGRGAMGVTYRATERTLNRSVALKVIETHGSEPVRERFLREARAAAALRHPNVAGVFRFGALPNTDRCYCAMELVEGETLDALVRRDGPLEPEAALEIAIQVTRALIAAAERGLVHRDLKPANIMLTRSENAPAKVEVKVIDFGLAKAASTAAGEMELTHGGFVGTPAFASPEQFARGAIDARTDIYTLGVTLWFALSGRRPFSGRTIEEIRHRRTHLPLEQLEGVPRRVIELLRSCLAVDPAERPDSARVLLKALESCRTESVTRRRTSKLAGLAAVALLTLGIAALMFWRNREHHFVAPAAPEKSIAVLPFENLSEEKANAYFAEGVQDEILTRLAAVRDLKVISRTSTAKYKSKPDNLKNVGQELGVSTILEGSVQKAGDKVRVNVQLIKTASDSHLWAQTFDRKLTDLFSVESEIAKTIADQLQAKLTGEEEQVIAAKPTDNTEAYDAYLRGLAYSLKTANTTANALSAQKYLREAVHLDPKFALAWALLSYVEARAYRTEFLQPTIALREEARHAAETALTLQPNLGEAVLAKGFYHYACLRDYDTAVRYFEEARPLLPNSSRIPESLAYVTRKQGEWDRSESFFNEAERLDPRNVSLLTQHALSYKDRRLFPEALRKLEQILNIAPDDVDTSVEKAVIAQAEGDLPRASALLSPLHIEANDSNAFETQVYQAILERRPTSIIPQLQTILAKPDPALGYTNGELRFWLGWAQEVSGDHTGAEESWRKARQELESFLKEHPEDHILLGDLALTDACLGDKAAAFALTQQAMAAVPIEKDAVSGPTPIEILARVAAQLGEADRAIAALQKLMATPYSGALGPAAPLTPALLRLDPMFDPLRNDPRFQKLAAANGTTSSGHAEIPEKSIAVLPFENRSRDPDNAFFTDGVQDEILTDLAKIADLKVISRTSVMQYKSGLARNLRKIGEELGVAHVVEGSVQRAANKIRVNAQLIDARNDAHLWAQTYDRDLADVFAIQSEIAKAIADQLQAKLSPTEKSAIEQPPTTDITAFDLYSHAKNLFLTAFGGPNGQTDLLQAADLLKQAVALDPSFFQAYCQLAFTEINIYGVLDHSPAYLAQAEAALLSAVRLRPDAGETHLARARNLYWGYLDYDGALRELEIARQSLPGEDWIFSLRGYIERRQGRWEECIRDLERATELDPRNIVTLQQLAQAYGQLRRYTEEKSTLERILAFQPNDSATKSLHALVELDSKANTRPLHEVIDLIRDKNPAALSSVADAWLLYAFAERDPGAASKALIALGENPASLGPIADVRFNRPFMEGIIANIAKDDARAQAAFTVARTQQEKIVQAQPNYGPALCVLGLIDAALGRKEEALKQGRRAVELCPMEKDATRGVAMVKYLAMIAVWVGEKDLACEKLAIAIRKPGDLSYGQLKLMPFWDALRGDPRFEKIVGSLAPKEN
jgi:TolB-like protein/Tfp pilus assembly protein PilF